MAVMPMFPLGMTLLPGAVLPLQVFEPRYLQMVQDILRDDVNPPEFGVTLIERGHEVGGGDARATIGTVARIIDMQVTPDGRYVLASVGTERLRINAWLPDDPYPLADVELWPDEGDHEVPDDVIESLHRRVRDLNEVVRSLGDMTPPPDTEIAEDQAMAVYHLGSLSPLGAADRYRLLAAPGLAERIQVLSDALDDAAAVLEFRRT
jgi:Lon protease-like protein